MHQVWTDLDTALIRIDAGATVGPTRHRQGGQKERAQYEQAFLYGR
jgi:hypothetical protein